MSKDNLPAIVYHPDHRLHQTRNEDPCEVSERVELIKDSLIKSGKEMVWIEPEVKTPKILNFTHNPEMVNIFKFYSDNALDGDEIFTSFCQDSTHSTPITHGSYDQAVLSACCGLETASLIQNKITRLAISLNRPPGHHAGRDFYHGFCYLNNGAMVAKELHQGSKKVAILDFDVHHCDGTQNIFEQTSEVLVVSIHADPHQVFPNTGFAHEQGIGKGQGLIQNFPFEVGISESKYMAAMRKAICRISDYNPDVLVVEAGFDAHREDHPPGQSGLTELSASSYAEIGKYIAKLDIPCCVLLEGGYALNYLADSFMALYSELESLT